MAAFAGLNEYLMDSSSGVFIVDCSVYSSSARFRLKMSQLSSTNAGPDALSVSASQLAILMDLTDVATAFVCMFGIAPLSRSGTIGSNIEGVGGTVASSNGASADSLSNKSARMIPIATLFSITLITSSL
ncbi:hypothetical protein G6F46_008031 [Rhizopus delemar]|uniref:Uncharacterized protein n=2 Tax=Rhizopus TaxID=4842 RepID=A0A9P6Z1J5_9FUNG|nr:hypothetical protein G6F55_005824 [Rhizopus delemar]KAG1542413.1 hypothetical protein G6F51_007285 [Rhizopus arrhizus]KAG1495222.1 hypothetical protein G6F54_007322 [Rhizopus delemar]KAG1510145.1 hypothetical protein G6F53_006906 [Rhizopus delemar]KAG1516115.1 hypothetical protein G6F52_009521 [Rhizopus delemar]